MSGRRPGLLVLAAVAGLLAAVPVRAGELEDRVTKAGGFVKQREYAKAIAEYKAALALAPDNPKVNLLLGLAYANQGDYDRAVKHTEASIRVEPSASAYHNLGLVHANRGDYTRALESYRKAIELNPSGYRMWYQLGLLQASRGDFADAVASYGKSVELNPEFADGYLGLGSAHYWSGNRQAALDQAGRLRAIKRKVEADALEEWVRKKDELRAAGSLKKTPSSKP